MTDARPRIPDRRVLRAAVDALSARRRLPARDPRRVSAAWLRPNWPFAFVMDAHRDHVVSSLLDDAELRAEVRVLLGSALLDAVPMIDAASDDLVAVLASAPNPELVLEAAATDPDPALVSQAVPYLTGELIVPSPQRPPAPAHATPRPDRDQGQARRELREARTRHRSLEEEVGRLKTERDRLHAELVAERQTVASQQATIAELKPLVPTARQRRQLDAAADSAAELRRTKRALDKAKSARGEELRALRLQVASLERELAQARKDVEIERASRHRLEQGLGDVDDRARRLAALVEREAADLASRAESQRPGLDRSRIRKRATALTELLARLNDLYQLEAPAETGPQARRPASGITVTEDRNLRVTALGGSNHIGGSAILVEAGSTRILVDAGLRPGANLARPGPERIEEAVSGRLDAVVITHAHADHAGYVPWVIEKQRSAKIYCTPQTKALLPTVWADSVRVMRAEADAVTGQHHRSEPPYGDSEVSQAEEALRAMGYGMPTRINDVEVTLFDAGHVLGAAGVVVKAGDRRVVITGDIDDRQQKTVGPAKLPTRLVTAADLLVIETTYCDSRHSDREQEGADLVTEANTILAAGGRILIPAFGLGRAQEIALLVGEQLPDVDVRVDGLAATISELYAQNHAPQVLGGRIRKVTSQHRAREIRGFRHGIIITTSGMLTGGAAVPWAHEVLQEPASALFLCGHQDEEAPGRELERLASAVPDSRRDVVLRDGNGRAITIPVSAKIVRYNLSAHADQPGLTGVIKQVNPQAIMLVHGEARPQATFGAVLEGAGYRVVDNQQTWDCDAPIPDIRAPRRRHAGRRGTGRR